MGPHAIISNILNGDTLADIVRKHTLPQSSTERLNWWIALRCASAMAREFAPREVYQVLDDVCGWACPVKEVAK